MTRRLLGHIVFARPIVLWTNLPLDRRTALPKCIVTLTQYAYNQAHRVIALALLADGCLASGPAGTATKVWKRATRRVRGGPQQPFWAPGICGSGKVGNDEAVIELPGGLRRLS